MRSRIARSALSGLRICGVLLSFGCALLQGQQIKVTLLGTGGPAPVMNRFGPSILVEAGGRTLLFDAGFGAFQRLTQIKKSWSAVDGVFFTHLHSDHVVGFPDLWLTGWLVSRRGRPLEVWGSRGVQRMMEHLEQAYELDIRMRLYDGSPPDGVVLLAKDIEGGFVHEAGGVRVTAFEVDHRAVKPAFGYRIDYGGRSVVLSGDTRPSENLIRSSKGVDLLIHEVIAPNEVIAPKTVEASSLPSDGLPGLLPITRLPSRPLTFSNR